MAKIANVALTNTFDSWRTRSNEAFDRLSQFAINNSSLYANTLTANVSFVSKGTSTLGDSTNDLTTITGRATVGTNLTVAANTTTNKLFVTAQFAASGNVQLGDASADIINIKGKANAYASMVIAKNLTVSGNTTSNKVVVTSSITGSAANATFNKITSTSSLDASTANTLIGKLSANGSLGTANYALKTNGTTVFWGPVTVNTTQYLQVANAVATYLPISTASSTYQTKAIERAALANTNARIASVLSNRLGATAAVSLTGDVTGSTNFSSNSASISTTVSSSIMKASVAFTKTSGDVIFNDNISALFGTGSDLKIFHDGSNSFVIDQGTGNLYLRSTSGDAYVQVGTTEVAIHAIQNGAVKLYYDNTEKLTTSTSGIAVLGDVIAYRPATPSTGALYFGDTGTKYLYYDGTNFSFSGGSVYIGGVQAVTNSGNWSIGAATFTSTSQNSQFNSIGVGTAASGTAGEIRATNNITAYYSSDARLKTNVVEISDALSKVNQIRGVEFDWTDEYIEKAGGEDNYFVRKHDVGVIAQEIEKVLPEVVAEREDGIKAVKYDRIVALLIEAVKDLSKQVEELKANK